MASRSIAILPPSRHGKKDEFRWLNTAGTRWGVDMVGEGKLTAWKAISAEEVTAEIVAALANRDNGRFARVLLSSDELQSIGLGKAKSEAVAAKIVKAADRLRHSGRSAEDHRARNQNGCNSAAAVPASCRPAATIQPAISRFTRTSWPSCRQAKSIRKCRSAPWSAWATPGRRSTRR